MLPQQLCRVTQTVVYSISTAYGFQEFNLAPESEEWVTATAGLAADQLAVLLRDAAIRRLPAQPGIHAAAGWQQGLGAYIGAWKQAVHDVHTEYFEEYKNWQGNLCLDEPTAHRRDDKQRAPQSLKGDDQVLLQLLELSLQFCIYTEAANLRHTPHLLCLIYYIMRSACTFQQTFDQLRGREPHQQQVQPLLPHTHWQYWLQFSAEDFPGGATRAPQKPDSSQAPETVAATCDSSSNGCNSQRADSTAQQPVAIVAGACDITILKSSLVQQLYKAAPATFKGPAASALKAPLKGSSSSHSAQQAVTEGLQPASSSEQRRNWLRDTCDQILLRVAPGHKGFVAGLLSDILQDHWMQKQQKYLRLVVQPLFFFLAEQIDLAGQQEGEDPSLRIAYDDVDEHCCSPGSVRDLIALLEREYGGSSPADDLWTALEQALTTYNAAQQTEAAKAAAKQTEAAKDSTSPTSDKTAKDKKGVLQTAGYPRDPKRVQVLEGLAQVLLEQGKADAEAAAAGAEERTTANVSASAAANARLMFTPEVAIASEPEALNELYDTAKSGADWWRGHMFKHKTFVEARSIAAPFVSFWRVYAFHAALLTVMASLAYVWSSRQTNGNSLSRYIAAVLLCAVTDALMRAARAGAYITLSVYTMWPVKRKVRGQLVKLNPFPPGSLGQCCRRLVQLLIWFCWAGLLCLSLVLPLSGSDNKRLVQLCLRQKQGAVAQKPADRAFEAGVTLFWMVPALAHILTLWGFGLLCQRYGYTASLRDLQYLLFRHCSKRPRGKGASAACSSDPKIDALFYPARNLRTDKRRARVNAAIWVAVVAIKVAFEFFFVILPLVQLMLKLVTTSAVSMLEAVFDLNTVKEAKSDADIASDVFIITALAAPVVLMSFSDTGMFFSVVGAMVSAAEGFKRAVGSIKTWTDLVRSFEVIQIKYLQHCTSYSAKRLHLDHFMDDHTIQQASISALAAGWNALVLDLRERDLLNNRELASLTFEQLQLTHSQKRELLGDTKQGQAVSVVRDLMLTTVLPARCFLAGAVAELASGAVGARHHLWVAQVVWHWLLWVVWQAGLLQTDNTDDWDGKKTLVALTKLKLLYPAQLSGQSGRWQKMLSETLRLLALLSKASPPSNLGLTHTGLLHGLPLNQKELREAARDLSHAMNNLINLMTEELNAVCPEKGRKRSNFDMTASEIADARAALKALRKRWGQRDAEARREEEQAQQRQTVLADMVSSDGLLPQRDQLVAAVEHIARVGGASDAPAQVARYLADVLTMHEGDTQPADEEAVRFILGFASSLKDPDLGQAPSLKDCPTLCTLVPHYNEDVLYALSEDDALTEDLKVQNPGKLDAKSKAEMLYLLTPEGCATPTLSYLRSVYNPAGQQHTQWSNFVERIKAMAAKDPSIVNVPSTVYEHHFLPGGPLHELKEELLLWASWRGQLLARTVRGLMSYRTALQAIARHENPHFVHLMSQQQQPTAAPAAGTLGAHQPPQQAARQQAGHVDASTPAHQAQLLQAALDQLLDRAHLQRNKKLQLKAQQQHCETLLDTEQALYSKLQQELKELQQLQLQQQQQHEEEEARDDPKMMRRQRRLERQLQYLGRLLQDRTSRLGQLTAELEANQSALEKTEQELQPLQQQQLYWEALRDVLLDDLVDSKCHLVVSSQNLGVFASKVESEKNLKSAWLAYSIQKLREKHPAFKVAYIDRQLLVTASRPGHKVELFRHASVLLTSTRQQELAAAVGLPGNKQAYRVLLPINFESARGVMIGEGKPENQNHAVVFCPGEALQTIDCNQDNIVAEGLKIRNLLAELRPELRKDPTAQSQPEKQVALVGFREWIFSEDSGVLAEFAAATERSFGTTVQRLMYNPGAVRFHYGHPDVWSRVFVSTCGGVSKPNKSQHVSEDVFGGYNVILRGKEIKYVDYIAVGKGRDMGFETINTFEAKIAAGNGEQVLSRDVRRLAHNMSFARLLTWYHTGNGFFINTALNMVAVHASLWAFLLLALGKSSNAEVQATLSAVQLLQLGSLSMLVYLFTLGLEIGIFRAMWTILRQTLQGSLMFYIFRAQTSAYSFTYDLLFGGAKYLPTGRGYKLAATSFKDLYRRFGRSHFFFGVVLVQYAVACIAAGHQQGVHLLVLWGPLLVVLSLLFGPFWFIPFAFRTATVREDTRQMQAWFNSPSPDAAQGWSAWNAEAWQAAGDAAGKQQGRLAAALRAVALKLPSLLLILGATARMKPVSDAALTGRKEGDQQRLPKYLLALIMAGSALIATVVVLNVKRHQAMSGLKHHWTRVLEMFVVLAVGLGVILSGVFVNGPSGSTIGIRNFSNTALVAFATVLLLRLLPLAYYLPRQLVGLRSICNAVYYLADVILTYMLNGMRFVLSLFDILTGLQAQLLFNTAYARQVMVDTSLEHSPLPKLVKHALQQQQQQRKQLQKQQQQSGAMVRQLAQQ